MSDTIIANRYATALFESTKAAGSDPTRAELTALADAVAGDELAALMANPRVAGADKHAVLKGVGEALGASDKTMNLLALLVSNGRANMLGRIAECFGELVDAAEGRLMVSVTAAIALPDDVKGRVEAKLTEILGGNADIGHRIDSDILGGLVIQIGSKVFDNSIRHHLAQLRQGL